MSFIGAMMMLAAVPTACPPDDEGVKTEKKMVGDDFNIVRDEVIDGIRYITAAPSAIVCSVRIDIHLIDDVVDSVVYTRGCNGNAKGIGAWCDFWGYDVEHDWPWWKKQIRYFLPYLL